MAAKSIVLFSIGHSNHEIDAFINLLRKYDVTTVVDVRSQPYSQWVPVFNRKKLGRALRSAGLQYRFRGEQLGGRPDDRSLFEPGGQRPDYDRMAKTPEFQEGIEQLIALAQEAMIAFMCSEGDYRQCHRHHLITPELLKRGVTVMHILPDGRAVEAELPAKQLSLF